MTLSAGSRLGPYEIVVPLGAGGMGEVYRARDERLGRDVAVKVLPETVASDPARLRRFEQEARSASALNHPNIVTIYDVGREGPVSFIAMELVEGESLRQRLASGPLPVRTVLDVGAQIASGLAKAHATGLVHRDLKPENVMMTGDGLVKILDFGLAKLAASSASGELESRAQTATQQTEPGAVLGTVAYMSPEQASGRSLDFRSDQFSLGVMLYEMASGLRPFQRATAVQTLTAILQSEPPPLPLVNSAVPEALQTIVRRCLAKEPEGRRRGSPGALRSGRKDVFAVQDDISGHIARSLQTALGGSSPAGSSPPPTSNLEAYDAFLRGRYYLNQFDWVKKDESIPLFEKAVRLDPSFATAHAALASAYAKKAFEGDPNNVWRSKATAEIERALALDPNLSEAYLARGSLAWTRENGFPHEQAAADFRKAIELNPSSDAAHGSLASLYYHVGLLEKSLQEYEIALKINPHNLDYLYRIPRIHLYQQKYAQALAEFDANPQFRDDFLVPIVLAHLGRWEEAFRRAGIPAGRPTHPSEEEAFDQPSTRAVLHAHSGDFAQAEKEIAIAAKSGRRRSHFHHASYNIATAYALMGKKKEALQWLEETAEGGMPCYPLFEKDPYLDSLRGDPDFIAFLSRMRTQWKRFGREL